MARQGHLATGCDRGAETGGAAPTGPEAEGEQLQANAGTGRTPSRGGVACRSQCMVALSAYRQPCPYLFRPRRVLGFRGTNLAGRLGLMQGAGRGPIFEFGLRVGLCRVMRQERLKCARAGARSDEAEGQAEDAAVADAGMQGHGARMPFRSVQQEVPSCNLP